MGQAPVTFPSFGGLRLDLALDEVGADNAIFLRDVDWDGSVGKIRSRDGFQKLKAASASGPYKGLFPHSAVHLLATKRVSGGSVKVVAIDQDGEEKAVADWTATAAKSCFTRFGTPAASYTYGRAATPTHKVVRFDGATFTEPSAKVGEAAGKEMPRGAIMLTWPDAGNVLVTANTAAEGGPNNLASSNSHVWFSMPGSAEEYEPTDYAQLSPGDGEEIVAGAVFGGQLFLFKETKFFVFSPPGLDEEGRPLYGQAFREVTLGEGSRMKRASAEVLAETSDQLATTSPNGVYFCTTDGVYWTTGGQPTKISQALKPLEEATPFDGPMADFLNGATETFRWPASGIVSIGQRLIVRRYEFTFFYDIPTDAWGCLKMPAVSMAVWTGLSGGGVEASARNPATASQGEGEVVRWQDVSKATGAFDGQFTTATLSSEGFQLESTEPFYFSDFGHNIPEAAVIKGIKMALPRYVYAGGGQARDGSAQLRKAGTPVGEDKSGSVWAPVLDAFVFGGPEDLWGVSWTPAEINAGLEFTLYAVLHSGTTASLAMDSPLSVVYFTLPESSSGIRPRLFASSGKSIYWTGPSAEDDAGTSEPAWQSGFYDLELDDEKSLSTLRLYGTGDVDLAVAKDFGEVGASETLELGTPPVIGSRQVNKSQTASLFSHRFSGDGPWSVQRMTRWLREEREPTTKD